MPVNGILFDIGDTLVPATALARDALRSTARALASASALSHATGFLRAYAAADRDPSLADDPDLNHLFSDVRIVERALELLGQPAEPAVVARFLTAYRAAVRAGLRPDPELRAILATLRRRGTQLGIVSNGTTAEQREQLQIVGIEDYFDPIIISQAVGIRKPDPRIFTLARDAWRMPAADILVVGDRGDWEIRGARAAGMRSALTTQFVDLRSTIQPDAPPDYIIAHLRELLAIVPEVP